MIAIVNVDAPGDPERQDPGGLRKYEVRINHAVITTFEHYRRDSLTTCLRKAADAMESAAKRDLEAPLPRIVQMLKVEERNRAQPSSPSAPGQ